MIALTETAILSPPGSAGVSPALDRATRTGVARVEVAGGTPALPGGRQHSAEDTMSPTTGRTKAEDYVGAPNRPFTGKEYLESLRDGREIYVYGERVPDVTAHPAFRNAARSIAKLYDALHDPATMDVLTCPTDTGNGGYTHKFFRVAHSREELIGQRDAIAAWARMSYGWMGRTPDYKASLMNTLGANYVFYDKFAANAQNWHRRRRNIQLCYEYT